MKDKLSQDNKILEIMESMKSESIVWEESHYSKTFLYLGLIFLAPGIFLCICGVIYFSIVLLSFGLIVLLCPLLYIGGPRAYFFIKFTKSTISFKRRYFGHTKKFMLSDIFKIEIEIYKKTEHYRSDPGVWSAELKFRINIYTASKVKNYSFYRIFSVKKTSGFGRSDPEAKENAMQKRTNFENSLRNLEVLFPQLIFVNDVAKPQKELGPGFWGATICFISLLLMTLFVAAFVFREERFSLMIGIILYSVFIGICITNTIYRYLKQKKKNIS